MKSRQIIHLVEGCVRLCIKIFIQVNYVGVSLFLEDMVGSSSHYSATSLVLM
jgi:hypothetical protein